MARSVKARQTVARLVTDKRLRGFLLAAIDEMEEADVTVSLSAKWEDGTLGTFEPPRLRVMVGRDLEWAAVFIHEFCHFRQCRENTEEWQNSDLRVGPRRRVVSVYEALADWAAGRLRLTRAELVRACESAQALEFDCERRTAALMTEHRLPFNVRQYTKRANAYVLYYSVIPALGVAQRSVSGLERRGLWSRMPAHFDYDPDVEWRRHVDLFWRECYA